MSSSTDILRIFFTSIQYKINSSLQAELSTFFPANVLLRPPILAFISNLFEPIDYSTSDLTTIENQLYIIEQFRIYTNAMYSLCTSTNSSIRQSYYDNINNYIVLLNSAVNNIKVNQIWISASVNSKLNTFQIELQPNARVLVDNFFYCVSNSTDPPSGTMGRITGTNLVVMKSGCNSQKKEVWKVKKIESRFINKPEHFDYMKNHFPNFNERHIERFDMITLTFPYSSQKLKPMPKLPTNFKRIHVEDCNTADSFNVNKTNSVCKMYIIFLPPEFIHDSKLKITHYTIRNGKRCFVCLGD